ncbi:MAG: hypothetical protein NWF04_05050 [Candidatus Bathyarchaeota archaeon]|nr:hypothetical protein [Candidatus Bathyarchaeota archaeon]
MGHDEEVETLKELGLTCRQARVFLVLVEHKDSNARSIANFLKIARQDVYKVLDELEQLGLIEKQINAPMRFRAIPLQDAFSVLLNRRIEKTFRLQAKTKMIARKFRRKNGAVVGYEEPKLLLVPQGDALIFRFRKAVSSAQRTIDVISTTKCLTQALFFMTEEFEWALKNGVQIRFIVDVTAEDYSPIALPNTFLNSPNCKIRIRRNPSLVTRFCIYDVKELSVVLCSEKDFGKSSSLWSDYTSMVEAYQDYFDLLWITATDLPAPVAANPKK